MNPSNDIILDRVRTNNLKGVDVRIPAGHLSVVTGVSGSGKSSLVFDTLYGEAYRRYVESLSSFARQYLKALPKPDVARVENLPPAIAVKQARSGATSRSTVGTMTEVNDLLRIIFANLSQIVCHTCGTPVEAATGESMAKRLYEEHLGEQVLVAAPLDEWTKLSGKELKAQLESQGFSRVYVAGELRKIADCKVAEVKAGLVVVDRIRVSKERYRRLVEACDLALKVGRQHARIVLVEKDTILNFVANLSCATCKELYFKPMLALFSFNHPFGACPHCQGFGFEPTLDWDKVIRDGSQSLSTKGVIPFNFGSQAKIYGLAVASAKRVGIDPKKPFDSYTKKEMDWLREGDGDRFSGVFGFFKWLESKRHKAHYRIHVARFRKYVTCSVCNSGRLNRQALACKVGGDSFVDVTSKSVVEMISWLDSVYAEFGHDELDGSGEAIGVKEALEEAKARVGYLQKIGLGYLTFDRLTRTVSGGELQRINMARCLGSALTDTMYCLDEPTVGLHARDSHNLLEVLLELRDQGNTVVVVEHEDVIIQEADYLVEVGPEAGHRGGEITYAAKPDAKSTAMRKVDWGQIRGEVDARHWIELKGAATHNLKNLNVRFPVGRLSAVCGVSGSGKTSLIQHTLYPMLAKHYGHATEGHVEAAVAKSVGPRAALASHAQVVHVSQSALGRSSRSNIATYLGLFDEIRKLLADTPEAKKLKLRPGHFSFNTKGGRCETCRGLGTVVEDLSFLGDMEVICPTCKGQRFDEAVRSIQFRGKSMSDLLKMTVLEVRELFFDRKPLVRVFDQVIAMGLSYVTLGQNTSSFSGGEAQRLKLLRLMKEARNQKPSVLIFDEPTTGLSDRDVVNLLEQFRYLTELGHTVIVVEHHLGVLRSCDWIVEIGPEAADAGGQLVFEGTPKELIGENKTLTAKYLQ